MFDHIGSKIKTFARVICWIGIVASIVCGIVFLLNGSAYGIVTGLLTIVIGSLMSWLGSFMTYGFGQLVDNSDKLVAHMENQKEGND